MIEKNVVSKRDTKDINNTIKAIEFNKDNNTAVLVMESIELAKQMILLDGLVLLGHTMRVSPFKEVNSNDLSLSNINKEKIEISLDIVKKGNDFKYIDVSKISDTKVKTNVVDNDTIIDISSVNKTGEDINALNGFVVLYNSNKIVNAKDFRIENIKNNNDIKTSITISKIVVPSTELNPDEVNYGPVNYDKIEVYYTYAY